MDLAKPLGGGKRERLNPVSQNVVNILLRDMALFYGEPAANLVQALLLFGEDHVLAHTTLINERDIMWGLIAYHGKFAEAQGGPAHDYEHCPYRGWTPGPAQVPGAER